MKRTMISIGFLVIGMGCSDPGGKPSNSATNANANNVADGGNNANNRADGGNNGGGPVVCEGFEAPTDSEKCRSDADCSAGGYCAPGSNTACGIPCGAPQQCFDDAGCVDGEVCQIYDASQEVCCYQGDTSAECVPACEPNSCRADHTCEADGHCRPTSCEAGFTCAGDLVCAPNRGTADEHGCASPDCTVDDYDCPEGFSCDANGSTPTKCAQIHCDDGYECPENFRCDSAAEGHGCVQLTCASDGECDCGACVNSACEPFAWICAQPAA